MSMQHDASPDTGTNDHDRRPSPARGLLTLAGAVVVVGTFIALARALSVGEIWVGFLFALYWAGLERGNFKRIAHCFVGAALGLSVAHLFVHVLPQTLGARALLPILAITLFLVYFQIMRWLSVAINMVTMLFLLVATIPMAPAPNQFPQQLCSLTLGAVYFWAVIKVANEVSRRGARNRAVHKEA